MKKMLLASVIAAILSGCGGGGSDSGNAEQPWFDETGDTPTEDNTGNGDEPENGLPSVTGLPSTPLEIKVRDSVSVNIAFNDPDGDPLTVSLSETVPGVSISEDQLTFDPSAVGEHTFQILMNDGKDVVRSDNVTVVYIEPDSVLLPFTSAFSMTNGMRGEMIIFNEGGVVELRQEVFDTTTPVLSLPNPMPEDYAGNHVSFRLFEPDGAASYQPSVGHFTLPETWHDVVDERFVVTDDVAESWQTNAIDTGLAMTLSERRYTSSPFGASQVDSVAQQHALIPHIAPSAIVEQAAFYYLSRNDGKLLWLNEYIEPAFAGLEGDDIDAPPPPAESESYRDAMALGTLRTAWPLITRKAEIEEHVKDRLAHVTWNYFNDAYADAEDAVTRNVSMPDLESGRYMLMAPEDADFGSQVGEAFEWDADAGSLTWLSSPLPGVDADEKVEVGDHWRFSRDGVAPEPLTVSSRASIGAIVDDLTEQGVPRIQATRIATMMVDDADAELWLTGERSVHIAPVINTLVGKTGLWVTQESVLEYRPGDEDASPYEAVVITDKQERWLSALEAPSAYSLNTNEDNVVAPSDLGAGWYSFYYQPQVENWAFSEPDAGWAYMDGASVEIKDGGWQLDLGGDTESFHVAGAALMLATPALSQESGHYSAWREQRVDGETIWTLVPFMLQEKDLCNTFPAEDSTKMCNPSPYIHTMEGDGDRWIVHAPGDSMVDPEVEYHAVNSTASGGDGVDTFSVTFAPERLRGEGDLPDEVILTYSSETGVVEWAGREYWPVRVSREVIHLFDDTTKTFLRFQRVLNDH